MVTRFTVRAGATWVLGALTAMVLSCAPRTVPLVDVSVPVIKASPNAQQQANVQGSRQVSLHVHGGDKTTINMEDGSDASQRKSGWSGVVSLVVGVLGCVCAACVLWLLVRKHAVRSGKCDGDPS